MWECVHINIGGEGIYVLHSCNFYASVYHYIYSVGTLTLVEDLTERKGFYIPVKFICSSCENETSLPTSTQPATFYAVNRRMVLGFRLFGAGRRAQEQFCSLLNMPPTLSRDAFGLHRNKIHLAVMEEAQAEFQRAALELQTLHQETDGAGDHGLVDVQVSGDGTWMRRGFSSLYVCFLLFRRKLAVFSILLFLASTVKLVNTSLRRTKQVMHMYSGNKSMIHNVT